MARAYASPQLYLIRFQKTRLFCGVIVLIQHHMISIEEDRIGLPHSAGHSAKELSLMGVGPAPHQSAVEHPVLPRRSSLTNTGIRDSGADQSSRSPPGRRLAGHAPNATLGAGRRTT